MSSPSSSSAAIDFRTQLHAIPVRNEGVQVLDSNESRMVLAVKLNYEGPMLVIAKLLSLRQVKKYEIDGLSLKLYRSLDGVKTAGNLVDSLMDSYKLSFFEARALIAQYLSDLMRRGLVAVAVKKEDEAGNAKP